MAKQVVCVIGGKTGSMGRGRKNTLGLLRILSNLL